MSDPNVKPRPALEPGKKLSAQEKMARIPVKIEPTVTPLRKPSWIRVRSWATPEVARLKKILRDNHLHTVCEEASCPNIGECFGKGTATFMIMGDVCTRRCTFCDVAHGRPGTLDTEEPQNLARTIKAMSLKYVVVTSVDRDDLRDGGAGHFIACIRAIREQSPATRIEVLVPDFRGRMDVALALMQETPPDVFNHNLETVPRLYREVRPGSDYTHSLMLLKRFKEAHPGIPTKSGIMIGLGEELPEIFETMQHLRDHSVNMLTVGQYLQPSKFHHPVMRYMTPEEFQEIERRGYEMGFDHVASGALVRSSYHADKQAEEVLQEQAS
ncbi:MAG TPA: lipoyl synthase [Gammaproteobacteria bacterium]|nr:lipoyl synthase [Gammaproteobacteria bacterium]